MEIAYTAHTETCTLLLDGEGICRSVVAASIRKVARGGARPTRIPSSAERCIGAQYVATLDLSEPGGMSPLPKPGAQMLFARTEKNGRITLIRSAPVVRFEATAADAKESGVHARPNAVSYGDDEELTTPFEPPTMAMRRSSLPPPPTPQRNSGVVPAGTAARASIPPPPPTLRDTSPPRVSYAPPPSYPPPSAYRAKPASTPPPPKRPSLVRVSAPFWDAATQPFKRAAR